MQSWSLERKVQVSQTRIIEWYQRLNGLVYVSFSGGKDSTVLLDLVRRIYPEIPAVFCDTGLEYPEIKEFVKNMSNVVIIKPDMIFTEVIHQYGYPVISKEVARILYYAKNKPNTKTGINHLKKLNNEFMYKESLSIYNCPKWKFLLDSPFSISDYCCEIMKKRPFKKYSKDTGRMAITGTLAQESQARTTAWLRNGCNAFGAVAPTSKPLSFWTEQDILRYLTMTKIPYCSLYGDIDEVNNQLVCSKLQRTGCMFCMFGVHLEKSPNRFEIMKKTHPKIYDYCIHKLHCGQVLDYIGVPY